MTLDSQQKQVVRKMTLDAGYLCLRHKDAIHYTQGSARWEGIDKDYKAWKNQYPFHGDCSSMATWWLWNGLDHFHSPDVVNGEKWEAGYTGTMLHHGVASLVPAAIGDLIIYGPTWPGEHVAMYVGNGLVISHGSEAGPFLLKWNYRTDILSRRRYI